MRTNTKKDWRLIDYVREYISAESVIIEFGAIPPILTIALTNLGYQVCALDIAPERFSNTILSSGLDIRKANIETHKLPFESNTFHAALFNEIFEHLRINPIETLGEVIRVLKPGGTLLLSTPNLASLKGYRELIFRKKAPGNVFDEYMKLETLGHMGHVREYTPIEVCTFLEGIGFEIREVIFRGKTVSRSIWKSTIFNTILFLFHAFVVFSPLWQQNPLRGLSDGSLPVTKLSRKRQYHLPGWYPEKVDIIA